MLAVIPIFITTGATVLPTVVGALASLLAVVLRPGELLRLCRRRPAAVSVVLAIAVVLSIVARHFWPDTQRRAAWATGIQKTHLCDWAKVAEDILAQERAGRIPSALADEQTLPQAVVGHALGLGYDFSRCGYLGGPSPVKLNRLWRFMPEDTMFISAPVAVGNQIFIAGCQADLGSYSGLLACLDGDTGEPLWQTTQSGDEMFRAFFSSPAITADGKYLVLGQGLHADRDCSLLCFEAQTGRLHWRVSTSLHIESSPAIFGDLAVVGAGAVEGPDGRPTGHPGEVIAVRISDGKELWRQPVNDPESSPAIDENGIIYIGSGFNGQAIVALRSDSDEVLREKGHERILWTTPVALPVTSPITLAGELVVAGAGNGDLVHSHQDAAGLVMALDRKTGQIRWQRPFEDAVLGGIAYRDGRLICPVRTGEVVALAAGDGRVLWRTHISGTSPVLAGCACTGPRVYAVSGDGCLAVLDAQDGKVLERTYLNDQAKPGNGLSLSPPQVVGQRVIVGSETGGLQCLLGSGKVE